MVNGLVKPLQGLGRKKTRDAEIRRQVWRRVNGHMGVVGEYEDLFIPC